MLKKIYSELVLIRKELQAIGSSKEFKVVTPIGIDAKEVAKTIQQAIHDNGEASQER